MKLYNYPILTTLFGFILTVGISFHIIKTKKDLPTEVTLFNALMGDFPESKSNVFRDSTADGLVSNITTAFIKKETMDARNTSLLIGLCSLILMPLILLVWKKLTKNKMLEISPDEFSEEKR